METVGPSQRPALLAVIKHNATLLRMAALWPTVHGIEQEAKSAGEPDRIAVWCAILGISRTEARRGERALFEAGICRTDGTVDPLAEKFIAQDAVSGMRRPRGARQ